MMAQAGATLIRRGTIPLTIKTIQFKKDIKKDSSGHTSVLQL